jgi:hypothetical protein
MLVVVAERHDAEAVALVDRWRDHEARLLSVSDISTAGWCHPVAAPNPATAVIDGSVVPLETITGVLTLLPCVYAQDLIQIVSEDRGYVAVEMTAFLASWLFDLTCPVLNRPTPGCLTGPNWRPAQWVHAAAQLGIPVRPVHRHAMLSGETAPPFVEAEPTTVTVIADCCIGEVDAALEAHARRLAGAARVAMLAVHFDGPMANARMLGAGLRPELASPEIADAILRHFYRSSGC